MRIAVLLPLVLPLVLTCCKSDQFLSAEDGGDDGAADVTIDASNDAVADARAEAEAGTSSPCVGASDFLFCDDFDTGAIGSAWKSKTATTGLQIKADLVKPASPPKALDAFGGTGAAEGSAMVTTDVTPLVKSSVTFAFAARIPLVGPPSHFSFARLALGTVKVAIELSLTKTIEVTSQNANDPAVDVGAVLPQNDGQWHRYVITLSRAYSNVTLPPVDVSVDGVTKTFMMAGVVSTNSATATIEVGLPVVAPSTSAEAFVDDVVVR